MKHSLTEKTLKSPTQKDFNCIFQWLYRRLDPGYKFQKSIDAEVPPILKQLRYPFENRITKNQIAAAGGQNWSTLLGLLYWLMQLAQMMDRFSMGSYDDACAEAGIDVSGDRIVSRFLFHAYQDWLSVESDQAAEEALKPHVQAMESEFERSNSKLAEELRMYEAENEALKNQIQQLEKSAPDIAKQDHHFKILEDDKRKFEDYNTNVQSKIEKYESRVKILDTEVQKTDVELTDAEAERSQLQHAVDKQGLNIQDIDRMNSERERLQKAVDDTQTALEEASRAVLDKEMDTARKLEQLEGIIKRYNSLGYELSLIPSTALNAKGQSFELTLSLPTADSAHFSSSTSTSTRHRKSLAQDSTTSIPTADRLLASSTSGHNPSQLLSHHQHPRTSIRPHLLSLRTAVSNRRKALQEAHHTSLDLLHSTRDAVDEKNRDIEALTHRVRLAEQTYSSTRDQAATQHTQYTTAIEKLEGELVRLRRGVEEGVLALEQAEMEIVVAWEAMQVEAGEVREWLHRGVEAMLEDVVRFKVRIQRGLEEFEGWVVGEVEGELLDGEIQGGEELGLGADAEGDGAM